MAPPRDPRWVDAILSWRGTLLAARLGLTSAYLIGGVTKLLDFPAAVAEQEHFGLTPGWLWATLAIVVELGGSVLVLSGRLVWLGAGALGVLTAVAMLAANRFWVVDGHDRLMLANSFFEHLGLIAGFVLVAVIAAREEPAPRSSLDQPSLDQSSLDRSFHQQSSSEHGPSPAPRQPEHP